MDQRPRKRLGHYISEITVIYIKKEEKRILASIKDSIDSSIQPLKDNIEKHEGGLIEATRNDSNNTKTNRMTISRKQKWEEKQFYGCLKRLKSNIWQEETCT